MTGWLSPRLVAFHLFSLAAIAGMLAAGLWQWDTYREHQEQASEQAQQALATAVPVPLASVLGRDDAFPGDGVGKRVTVTGEFSTRQFFVKNMFNRGRMGLWVLTPLRVDTRSAILVVRGWVPDATAPGAAVPSGRVTVVGALEPAESTSSLLSGAPGPGALVTSISPALLVGVLPFDLYSGYLVATSQHPDAAPGLVAVDPPTPAPSSWTGLRNALYAVQWVLFAGFGAYMWWRICRDVTQVARSPVRNVLLSYRIMAYIVGTLLVLLFIGVILKYLTSEGTDPQRLGEWLAMYVGVLHGFLYMVFLVTVAVLAAKARWSISFTLTTVISGLVPFMTFYAERRATARVREKFPETRPRSSPVSG